MLLPGKKSAERKIAVDVLFEEIQDGFRLTLCDEEKCQVSLPFVYAKNVAQNSKNFVDVSARRRFWRIR